MTINLVLAKEHTEYYAKVSRVLNNVGHPNTPTVMVGRPDEVLDDESFKWKVLEDKDYPYQKVTRATYVYQEQTQVSFISVLVDFEKGWAHGIVLTSKSPMNANNWLNAITLAELTVGDMRIPGSPIHELVGEGE